MRLVLQGIAVVNGKTLKAQTSGGLFCRARVKPGSVAGRQPSGAKLQGRSKSGRGAGRRKSARSFCRSEESQCVVVWGFGQDGSAARRKMETLRDGQRRRSIRTGRPVPIDGGSSPGDETLGVPVGWNKPASRRWSGPSGGCENLGTGSAGAGIPDVEPHW